MDSPAGPARRVIRSRTYIYLFLLFAALLFLTHLPLLSLPYFWDEAVYYVPAALDLFHNGAWLPHSVAPIVHPPGVAAYLTLWWKIAGQVPVVTRSAMLCLASLGMLGVFLLAIELLREARGTQAFLAVILMCVSPVMFAQAVMAQLDAPAMVFTTLALLLFLQDRIAASAAACIALVLMKETGAAVPVTLAAWLVSERRWREAAYYAAPLLALGGWLLVLRRGAGNWLGSPGFEQYNLFYLIHPVRLAVALSRRVYYLFFAGFHWAGTIAIIYAWRKSRLFRSRSWKVAFLLATIHVAMVTVLGGAMLERYLLPVMPILYTAMAAGVALLPKTPQRVLIVVLVGGVALSSFINPPYPFPYENNLAFADFVRLQMDAADYVQHWYPDAQVLTAWPAAQEFSQPELGFVKRPIRVQFVRNFSPQALAGTNWDQVQVLVAFSRSWDPKFNLMYLAPVLHFWQKYYGALPNASISEVRDGVPLPIEQHFTRRGQWLDIYVNPKTPRSGPREDGVLRLNH
jgi:4-amino-4-deoxy-L-arabinose transferase-like glycosyltransferase